ncbi:DUF4233 domain-containing protein [Microbacterium amylolyticum]|uniref:DUF4233 domain-containing protein n=1 Tax=Microbacterium amylolyticum TaxID=936337 RepID=A0ABS4ZFC0_9MICO|nr:DUF4233 domain-containing protein [Microbacterium amylolyticum]MBP2435698.1 hypothetical protein [Microbacterium amylolyticum]
MTDDSTPAPRPRRYRSLPEKLGSAVLGFESIVVFLAGLTVYGLRALPGDIPAWWAVIAGTVLLLVLILLSGMLRYRWARVAGWIVQGIIALGALLVPSILLITLIFGGLWAYAMVGGAKIERRVQLAKNDDDLPS